MIISKHKPSEQTGRLRFRQSGNVLRKVWRQHFPLLWTAKRFALGQVFLVLLAIALSVLHLSLPGVACAESEVRPNIVVIMTDDQGWGDLSFQGNTNLRTRNIDALVRNGALLESFYVCAVCSPTRAEFLTGRYHPRGGVYSTSTGGERLDLDEKTIGDAFRGAGYATGAFGKWHNGSQYPYHPNGRGFDEFYGFCSGHWGNYFNPMLEQNGKIVQGKGYITDDLTDHAISFIKQNKDGPFFCYLPFNTPHSPMQVPDRFYKKFQTAKLKMHHRDPKLEKIGMTRAALAMCENIDWNVGRIISTLDELNLTNNTIVIYFSDNGPNSWRWNGGMKGRKSSTDEGGVRSPCVISWPGHIKKRLKIPQIAAAIDLLPTLADIAGIAIPENQQLDGISIKRLLLGSAADWPDRRIFSHWNGRVSVRTQQYRLDHQGRLFDMVRDIGQQHDVSGDHPKIASQLAAEVDQWKKELLPGLRNDDRPFPVGYREFPVTMLPARDGVAHGNIQRSARAPNCSFFTNWTSTDDSITWDVQVATSGLYEAVVYYTCKPKDVGASIELSLHGSKLARKISEVHDPPLHGKENDRFDRGSESFVKDFKPLKLGTIRLQKGRGALTLRALEIPGQQVIDVRLIQLTLKAK